MTLNSQKHNLEKSAAIIAFLFLFTLITTACQASSPMADESADFDARATLDALGHPNPENTEAAALEPEITPTPAPTATVYIPEGQLFAYNFDEIPEGVEYELHPGILLTKPEYGFQIDVSAQTDYFLGAGLAGNNDANVSIYARNLSDPEKTIAQLACRAKSGPSDDGTSKITDAYIASLRFDGYTKLVRRVAGKDTVLGDWQKNVSLNAADLYNQLYLLCDGQRLLFMVNAQVAFDLNDSILTEGDYAIGISNNIPGFTSIVQFDKFLVYEP
jgi:hypothetical protein